MRNSALILAIVLSLLAIKVKAHGVLTDVRLHKPSVVVRSLFSETHPVADATVTIYSPAASEVVWQAGRTDKAGNFAFLPNTEGDWIFVVDDQKGHTKKLTITIASDFFAVEEPANISVGNEVVLPTASRPCRAYQTITGLSLIFGLAGIFYGVRSRKSSVNK